MILLNDKPVKFEEYSLYFRATTYTNGTLAIVCETEDGEPYEIVTINLSGYGMYPPNGCVFLGHNLSNDFKQLVIDMFGKETFPIRYGYATSVGIILKDEIKDKINGKKQIGLTDYEKYQLEWMIEHGYSLERLMECLEEVRMSLENSTDGIASIEDIFDIWEDEKGFNSEIWACEDEWKDNECEENDQPIGEPNVCPVCGEPLEDYDTFEMYSENAGYFKWRCGNCGAYGEENYELKFVGHDNIFDKDGNEWEE